MIQAEIQVIGKEDFAQGSLVTVELHLVDFFFGAVQVLVANVLGLNEPHGNATACEDEIGRPAGLSFWFVGGLHTGRKILYELLQITPEGMLSGIALPVALDDGGYIFGNARGGSKIGKMGGMDFHFITETRVVDAIKYLKITF